MRHRIFGLLIVVLLVAPAAATAAPQPAGDYVIVTLKSRPLASYTGGVAGLKATKPVRGKLDTSSPAYRAYERHLDGEHANYRAFLKKNAPRATVVREFKVVLNGFALKLNGTDPAALSRSKAVRSVGNSWVYHPTLTESLEIIEASAGWTASGGRADAGSGIDIGIIDSGIDADHDFFACKDEIASKVYASGMQLFGPGNELVDDHGTHVAGIAAGCVIELTSGPISGTISGVAPAAALFDYNVFPGFGGAFAGQGGAFTHDIAAAIEDAVNDGMDVINMSLGGSVQGPHDFLSEAANAAVDAGVVTVVAAGNTGPNAGTVESPGNAVNVITVGATTNAHLYGVPIVVDSLGTFIGLVGDFDPFEVDPVSDVQFESWGGDELACTSTDTDFTGKVVLIKRGTCTFSTKVANAAEAEALGAVIYNNVDGDVLMAGEGDIPAVSITKADGETIKAALPKNVTIAGPDLLADDPDVMTDFSSRGPGPFGYNIKPDVVAPGDNVYSSVFVSEADFDFFSGTSMATPHVAGAAALLLDVAGGSGELTPAEVKSLLGNNADRDVWLGEPGGDPAGVMDRGGGRVNIERALSAEAVFAPFSLSFGRHNGAKQINVSITIEVTNLSGGEVTYTISEGDAKLILSTTSLTLGPGATGSFSVALSARGTFAGEGDVTVSGGGQTYLLPYWYSTGNTSR